MTTHAFYRHLQGIGRSHKRTWLDVKLTRFQARHIVKTIQQITRKTLKQAIIHHDFAAIQILFGRLKNHPERAVKLFACRQILRSSKQS